MIASSWLQSAVISTQPITAGWSHKPAAIGEPSVIGCFEQKKLFFRIRSDEDNIYIKIVEFKEIYLFVVDNFLIWDGLQV